MESILIHHGILGQKWGVRRFQNKDGTLTAAGKKRFYDESGALNKKGLRYEKKIGKRADKLLNEIYRGPMNSKAREFNSKENQELRRLDKARSELNWNKLSRKEQIDRQKMLRKAINAENEADTSLMLASEYVHNNLNKFTNEMKRHESYQKEAEKWYETYEKKYGHMDWNYDEFEIKKK